MISTETILTIIRLLKSEQITLSDAFEAAENALPDGRVRFSIACSLASQGFRFPLPHLRVTAFVFGQTE